nr:protein SIEVE ELEMENT OCCLUSION B-like [Ipomoea batatas]
MANQTLLLSRRIIPHPTMTLPSPRSQVLDESIIREEVLSTHNYDGRTFNTNFILSIVENILSAKMGIGEEVGVEKLHQLEELVNYEELPSHIRQLSFEGLNDWNNTRVALLLTQGLDISDLTIQFLNWFAWLANTRLLWIPIAQNDDASWTTEDEQQFAKLKRRMSYLYWFHKLQKMISPQFIRFVKEQLFPDFQMGGEPIIVSLDQQGRIVHRNIMHMIYIWTFKYIEKNTLGVQGIYNITALVKEELKKGTSNIDHVIPEIKYMISVLVGDIDNKIVAWGHNIEKRIQNLIKQSTPYNNERENFLWQQEPNCSLDLVVGTEGRNVYLGNYEIQYWFGTEDYIFLYGGNDINWVREFTTKVSDEFASKIQLNVKLAYVGKNKLIRTIIRKEKLSHYALNGSFLVWWFWTRLRSMFLSRIHYLDAINHFGEECKDEILQGLKKLLTYEGKNTRIEGWALLSKGKKIVVCGHGAKILQVINEFEIWKENIATKGFDEAFKDHHEMLTSSSSLKSHSCCAFEYPTTLSKIPENEKCPECSYRMHKFVTFTCCHGHDIDSDQD